LELSIRPIWALTTRRVDNLHLSTAHPRRHRVHIADYITPVFITYRVSILVLLPRH